MDFDYTATKPVVVILGFVGVVLLTVAPLVWAVMRILRPVDLAAKERNLPFRFSMGDFLCLFWLVQLPLAFVFQMRDEGRRDSQDEADQFYWILTAAVWAVAPLAWFTVAKALSKAGVNMGMHRVIFLGVVLPTVYYGLFPFMGMSVAILFGTLERGVEYVAANRSLAMIWSVVAVSLIGCGFYSPWMVRRAGEIAAARDADEGVVLEPLALRRQ